MFGKNSRAIYPHTDISFYCSYIILPVFLLVLFLYLFSLFNIFLFFFIYCTLYYLNKFIYFNYLFFGWIMAIIKRINKHINGRMIYLVNNLVNNVIKSGSISNINDWSLQAVKLFLCGVLFIFRRNGQDLPINKHHQQPGRPITAAISPAIYQECRYFFICSRSAPAVMLTISADDKYLFYPHRKIKIYFLFLIHPAKNH